MAVLEQDMTQDAAWRDVLSRRRMWTRQDMRRLREAGLLDADARYELIQGEIVRIMGQGRRHILAVTRIFQILGAIFGFEFVQSQGTLPLGDEEPEPDAAVLRQPLGDYLDADPDATDVRLVVEVADSTLASDRAFKSLTYALAGIDEYWIVNIPGRVLEVHRQPGQDGYADTFAVAEDGMISPLAAPDAVINVKDLLP